MAQQQSRQHPVSVPFSEESEQALLGSLIIDPKMLLSVAALISTEDFFIVRNGYIWNAFLRLQNRQEEIDYLTLSHELEKMGVLNEIGGNAYITSLVNNTPTPVNVEVYAEMVRRASLRRKLLEAADSVRKAALDENLAIDDVLSSAETAILSVNEKGVHREMVILQDALSEYYERIEKIREIGEPIGIPTGFADIDNILGGLQRSDFLIFAGRTGMGKTSWLLSATINIARKRATIAIFTMEMSVEQIVQRMVAMESGLTVQVLRRANMDDKEMVRFTEVLGRLSSLPIYIDDTPALSPADVYARCRRLQHEVGLDVVIVDYLQFMHGGKEVRGRSLREETSYISKKLKELARELKVTVIAASQLNRDVEKRSDKRPMLSDLRESGSLEQDADAVMFLYRDSYYNDAPEFPGHAEIIVSKNRHGETGKVVLYFNERTTRFENAAREEWFEDLDI